MLILEIDGFMKWAAGVDPDGPQAEESKNEEILQNSPNSVIIEIIHVYG